MDFFVDEVGVKTFDPSLVQNRIPAEAMPFYERDWKDTRIDYKQFRSYIAVFPNALASDYGIVHDCKRLWVVGIFIVSFVFAWLIIMAPKRLTGGRRETETGKHCASAAPTCRAGTGFIDVRFNAFPFDCICGVDFLLNRKPFVHQLH